MECLKISKVIKLLQAKKKQFGDLPCCYAKDDEGNGYDQVLFAPTQMKMEEDEHGNLELLIDHLADDGREEEKNPTHICIN
jgi:hypothetical protein